jgi:hypothetical protein
MQTLEAASVAFNTWRKNKVKGSEPIPDDLWRIVNDLVPHYKPSQIRAVLGISNLQFNRHCVTSIQFPMQGNNEGFAEAIIPNVPQPDLCEVTLQGPRKSLSLTLPIQSLELVLPMLEQYL